MANLLSENSKICSDQPLPFVSMRYWIAVQIFEIEFSGKWHSCVWELGGIFGAGLRKKSPAEVEQLLCPSGQWNGAAEKAVVVLQILEGIPDPVLRIEFPCIF